MRSRTRTETVVVVMTSVTVDDDRVDGRPGPRRKCGILAPRMMGAEPARQR